MQDLIGDIRKRLAEMLAIDEHPQYVSRVAMHSGHSWETIRCPHCGAKNKPSNEKCISCGAPLS